MRRHPAVWCLLALAPLLGRCSLVVSVVEVPACRPASDDCEVLNREMAIAATACDRWVCSPRSLRCERTADADGDGELRVGCGGNDCDDANARRSSRGTEACDGLDNNCDQVVDEGVLARATATTTSVPLGADVDRLSASSVGSLAPGVSWHVTGGQQQGVAVLRSGEAQVGPLGSLRYQMQQGNDTTQPLALSDGCPDGSCGFGDLALDDTATASDWFATAIDVAGCTAGRVRVGLLRTAGAQAGSFQAVGPESRSTSFRGIGACGEGATAPTVARLQEGPALPRALASWVGSPDDRRSCETAAPVQVVGLWMEAAATPIPWVNATHGGAAQTLGMTRGRGRPAVVSWHRADGALGFGWFAAWADAAGGVAVQFVPPMGELPAFSPTLPPMTSRTTPDLDLSIAPGRIEAGSTPSDSVVLATGPQGAEGIALGIAWLDACSTGTGNVWFSRAIYQATARTFNVLPRVQLSAGGMAGGPALAYVNDEFVTGAFARGGATAGDGADGRRGGWLVAWAEGPRVMGRRIAALDGAPLDGAPVVLRDVGSGALRSLALLRNDPTGLRALWFSASGRSLESAPVLCSAQPIR
jgi:hypothetical protein